MYIYTHRAHVYIHSLLIGTHIYTHKVHTYTEHTLTYIYTHRAHVAVTSRKRVLYLYYGVHMHIHSPTYLII